MLKKLIFFWVGICLSGAVFAKDSKIVGFDQVFNLDTEHAYQLEIGDLNPSSQFWTAFYLVGVPKVVESAAKVDFYVTGDGLLEKSHPANPTEITSLVAENLPIRHNYSFKNFDDLVAEIEAQTGKKIQDPELGEAANVRVYGRILDWIPEYNLQRPAHIMFGLADAQDFDIKAAYLVVGEGDKTPQVLQLDLQQKTDPEQVRQSFDDTRKSPTFNLASMEAKFLIFLVIAAATIFLNWGKWRRS